MERNVDIQKLRKSVLEVSQRVYRLQKDCSYDLVQLPSTHSYLKEAEILCKSQGVKLKVFDDVPDERIYASIDLNKYPTIIVKKPKSKKKEINDIAGEMAIKVFGAYSKCLEKEESDTEKLKYMVENEMTAYSSIFFKGWKIGKKYMKHSSVV